LVVFSFHIIQNISKLTFTKNVELKTNIIQTFKKSRNGNEESTIGDVLTDAMLYGEWKDSTIAFINNGGIRFKRLFT
jgi:hypothetical protein